MIAKSDSAERIRKELWDFMREEMNSRENDCVDAYCDIVNGVLMSFSALVAEVNRQLESREVDAVDLFNELVEVVRKHETGH